MVPSQPVRREYSTTRSIPALKTPKFDHNDMTPSTNSKTYSKTTITILRKLMVSKDWHELCDPRASLPTAHIGADSHYGLRLQPKIWTL